MTQITAADVNKLRQITGVGMMDCKHALIEAEGDFEKAIEILRKKGQKVASKRADKETNEGLVVAKTTADRKYGAVVMINCETDFVAKSKDFSSFVNHSAELAIQNRPGNLEDFRAMKLEGRTLDEHVTDLVGKTGEKIQISRFEAISAQKVFHYNHTGNRLATILGMNMENAEESIGHELAMQVAAMNPISVDRDDVPPSVIEKEIEIGKEQARQEGKPENMLEKIAVGKLNKFYAENTLVNQEFVRDTKKTVGQYIKEHSPDLKVTGFKRIMLGT